MRYSTEVVLALALIAVAACDSPAGPEPDPTGDLAVLVRTDGEDADADGYTVGVASAVHGVQANDSTRFDSLPVGTVSVHLEDLADNCSASGDNPRPVDILPGVETTVLFEVSCSPLVGALDIAVSSDGMDLDPDGYLIVLDGDEQAASPIPVDGRMSIAPVRIGTHELRLDGVSDNCSVGAGAIRTADVAYGEITPVDYRVTCEERRGALVVEVATSGYEPDADGYSLTVGDSTLALAGDGSVTFDLHEGSLMVSLGDVADNCSVEGTNPRAVSIPYADTASAAFSVVCRPTRGAIRTIVETAGHDADPNGYLVRLDGGTEVRLGPDDEYVFSDLPEGPHEVRLSDLASHCSLSGTATRTVDVTKGSTADVSFQVSCVWRGPRLLTPAAGAAIQQNDPAAPCSDNPTRGRGFVITFDWSDASHPQGIAYYDIELEHAGASRPAVSTTTVDSRLVSVHCNTFVIDSNLTDWTWRVRAVSTDGETSRWSTRSLRYTPCRLSSGVPCYAPALAPSGSESLPDEGEGGRDR